MQTKLSKQELETWAVIAWAIWNARNKVYFEQFQPQPQIIWEGECQLSPFLSPNLSVIESNLLSHLFFVLIWLSSNEIFSHRLFLHKCAL